MDAGWTISIIGFAALVAVLSYFPPGLPGKDLKLSGRVFEPAADTEECEGTSLGTCTYSDNTFTREATTADSTSRVDYKPHWDSRPDFSVRSCALLRAEGLSSKLLFTQPGPPSPNYLVTHYEESYGRRRFPSLPILDPDHPSPALPTHLGSRQLAKNGLEEQQSHLPLLTVYKSAYQRHPLGSFCQRRAARASRSSSSHLLAANHLHKDLNPRHRVLLQVPDITF